VTDERPDGINPKPVLSYVAPAADFRGRRSRRLRREAMVLGTVAGVLVLLACVVLVSDHSYGGICAVYLLPLGGLVGAVAAARWGRSRRD
jgi:peptidoglycan/LPS O-acetylase OafA/YrhL